VCCESPLNHVAKAQADNRSYMQRFEIIQAARATHTFDYDLTEEEQAQIPEEERYFEFDAEMQIALRPDKPEQAPTLDRQRCRSTKLL